MELDAQPTAQPPEDLKKGMSGTGVGDLQDQLVDAGYTIAVKELTDKFFGDTTHDAVVSFQKKLKLVPNGIFDSKARWVLDDDHEHPKKFIVLGQVFKANGDPSPGLTVKAFDKDLRSEQLLKSDITRDNGEYSLFYHADDFLALDKGSADLVLRVFDGTVLQATSAIIYNAGKVERVNFTIGVRSEFERIVNEITPLLPGGVTHADLTEEDVVFLNGETRISAAWLTLLVESARRNREENTVPQSAFYGLFRQNLPTVLLDLLQNEIPVLRAALETSSNEGIIPTLSTAQLDQIAAALQALKARLILLPGDPGNISSFGDLLRTTALSVANQQRVAELQVQHGDNTESFWTAVVNNPNLSPSDKTDVRFTMQVGALTTNHIPLVTALRNAVFPNLIVEVNGPVPPAALSEDATGLRPFAVKSVADWKSLLQPPSAPPLGAPPTIPGATAQEKMDNYAIALNAYMENALPTPVIAGRVEKDTATDSPFRQVIADLRTFFRNNKPYEFRTTPIDTYLSTGRDQKLSGVVNPVALIAELKNMQRLFNVAPRYADIRSLRKDDLHSAMSMVKLGQRRFTEKYAAPLGGADKALEVYRKAQQTHATALNFYLNRALPSASPAPFVIPSGNGMKASPAKLAAQNGTPDLVTLFGSLDLCECDQCQSVYSPAAYFVDILKFLGDGPFLGDKNPLQVLLERRPDLEHIELTCENTSTEMPYVDLTREIMERAVAKREFDIAEGADIATVLADLDAEKVPQSFRAIFASKGYPLTDKASVRREPFMEFAPRAWVILDSGWAFTLTYLGATKGFKAEAWPQTSWTTDELRATPEHVNNAAYTTLRNAFYPWDLLLNLPVEESRVYLNHLGVKRHEVMETFFRGTPLVALTDTSIANEYLGVAKKEAEIITDNNSPAIDPWKFWNLQQTGNPTGDPLNPTDDWDVVLKRVSIFLEQSGITYRDLLELLGCYFINPATSTGRTLAIFSSDPASCNLSEMEIRVVDPAIPDANKKDVLKAVWNKIHRFVRLARKLGWTMRDLDRAIVALQPLNAAGKLDITSIFMVQLSHIERLRAQFDLPVVNILSFWAAIDTARYQDHFAEGEPVVPSLYAQLFNNKSAAGQSLAEDPATLTGKLSENAPVISAALQVTVDELNLMIADLNVVQEDKLSLANLSKLYRHATFARALNYPIRAYLAALKMISASPFNTTADTVSFAKQSEKILAAGFSVEDLNYILRHDFSSTSQIAIDDDAIAVILNSIREEVRKIATDNTFVEVSSDATAATNDPKGDVTKRKLALLNWDTGLIEQLVAILNGTFTHEAKLDTLPQGITFPPALQGRVSYDSIAGQLRFTGVMTPGEKADLLAASSDVKYQGAVQVLFDAPGKIVKRQMARFSVPRFTTGLTQFPPTVVIPTALKTKFYYDNVAKKLNFNGIMTDAERKILIANEPKDSNGVPTSPYGLAVEALFSLGGATPPDEDAFIKSADASALFDDPATTPPARFIIVLRKLLPYLRTTLSERIVTQRLTEILQLDAKAAHDLLTKWVNSPADPTQKAIKEFLAASFAESNANVAVTKEAFPRQFNTFTLLYKIAVLNAKFSLTSQQLQWLFEYGPGNGWLDLNSLPFATVSAANQAYAGWARLADLFEVRDALPVGETLLTDIFVAARDATTPLSSLLDIISKGAGWKRENLNALSAAGAFNFPVSAYRDEAALRRLQAAFAMLDQLGASADQCLAWTAAGADDAKWAQDVKSLVRATLDDAQWLEVAKTLNDPLRERQRAALVSYLVKVAGAGSANELYDDFLVDVEMSPCMMTTRLKQAIGSIQLFIQRSLMRLEEKVAMTETEAREWAQWRKQYRIWEANRKVLLYPENWIEPELRDGKTSFFEDLESELLQSDVTMDTAETAYLHYLEKLQEVARLEVAGMYRQIENDVSPRIDVLHVIGRTFSDPHVHYYRQQIDSAHWTPWQKIDVEIQGNHVIPLIWNRRLYVFWPMFATKQQETSLAGSGATVNPGEKVLEVQLAWTEYKNGKWSPKKLTSAFRSRLKHPETALTEADYKLFSFKSRLQTTPAGEKQLFIDCYGPVDTVSVTEVQPGSTLPAQDKLLFSLVPGGRKTVIATINNGLFQPSAKTKLAIVGRIGDQQISTAQLSDSGRVEIRNTSTTSTLKYYMVSSDYLAQNVVLTGQRQICWIPGEQNPQLAGGNGNSPALALAGADLTLTPSLTAVTGRTPVCDIIQEAECSFDLVPLQPANGEDTVTTTSTAAMQAIASFHFDDGQQTLTPLFGSSAITSIEPIVGTRYENMMMAEYGNTGDGLGQSKILQATPTHFRLLGMHQSYVPRGLVVPIFFQDEARTYFVVGVNGTVKVRFNTFFHPMVRSFFKSLNRDGISGLLKLPNQLVIDSPVAFDVYNADATKVDTNAKPREDVDFSYGGAYSIYNWELFFHAPFMIATQLSKNQRFEEAQKWFHYIFDPTATDSPENSGDPGPERFWRVKPLYRQALEGVPGIEELLADPDGSLQAQIREWQAKPFNPHVIARLRLVTYMKSVVMHYIDNLIAWGDQLFRRDTIESINEATQLYILAAQILGKRPEQIPARVKPKVNTFHTLDDDAALNSLANASVDIESFISSSVIPASDGDSEGGLPLMPFFAIPGNDKLLAYWNTVADRLFKIRHCQNIDGIGRSLPVFEPPIDPGLLVRSAAVGVDIASALSDINVALPNYRFNTMLQKAVELCGEVKSLGGALLSALEKRDAEALALLRSTHEVKVLKAVRTVKERQVEEAKQARAGLERGKELTTIRRNYYRDIAFMNPWEKTQLDLVNAGIVLQAYEVGSLALASAVGLIPNFKIALPTSAGSTYGGENLGQSAEYFSSSIGKLVSILNSTASMAGTMGGHQRRFDDWKLQERMANKELEQIERQIVAAEIRVAIAEKELSNHDLQMENTREADEFMRNKFTNRELYDWMVGQISGIYFQSYQLAYDVAKRAERAYRHELGVRESSFIQFGYWDSLKKGLLAGERLSYDLKRMEIAYLDQNKREYEIVKHVSLLSIDPVSLVKLKQTGECFVTLPEALFDIDYAGHYMRRIKSVGITVPCVAGPYSGINCTLTLQSSTMRHSNTLSNGKYGRQADDPRFADNSGTVQSIVTSGAQNDSGMFDTNLHDERYLPFEGQGAISTWRIEMPKNFKSFDYNTISDIVLHLRYTARDGGAQLKAQAEQELQTALNEFIRIEGKRGLTQMFSLRHEFPTEWSRFLNAPSGTTQTLTMAITNERFPFLFQGRNISIKTMEVYVKAKTEPESIKIALAAGPTAPLPPGGETLSLT
ncbi:MAG TPA: neuraminidase-like domain-containing protein, partial [Pyrinomonadaceae bacterium]|nr:neuraminidase-like domain-containing protein [Pyrinomonadaceae bacterium]